MMTVCALLLWLMILAPVAVRAQETPQDQVLEATRN